MQVVLLGLLALFFKSMSIVNDKIKEDLKGAMKSGDTEKRDVLRMVDSMIKNVEIEKGKRETGLADEEVMEVLMRAVKQRKDSVTQYMDGGRPELADKEQKEIDIISVYLPEQLSEEEVTKIVKDVISSSGVTNASDLGKVMGQIMARVKGQADGNLVKSIVQKEFEAMK